MRAFSKTARADFGGTQESGGVARERGGVAEQRAQAGGTRARTIVVLSVAFALAATLLSFGAVEPAQASSGAICSQANVDTVLNTGRRQTRIDKAAFYRSLQADSDFRRTYGSEGRHFAGTDAVIDYWNNDPRLKDSRWLAYLLATAWHETAFRMYPVRETLASTDERAVQLLARSSATRNKTYWRAHPETGHHYFGRGYVQLTWDFNYRRADERLGITPELENYRELSYYWNPVQALDPVTSIKITYDGMIYGWYTGHCLLRHFQPNRQGDWRNARRIINGMDRASSIGALGERFLVSIKAAEIPATFDEAAEAEEESQAAQERDEAAAEAERLEEENQELEVETEQLEEQNEELDRFISRLEEQLEEQRRQLEQLAATRNTEVVEAVNAFTAEVRALREAVLREPPPVRLSDDDRALVSGIREELDAAADARAAERLFRESQQRETVRLANENTAALLALRQAAAQQQAQIEALLAQLQQANDKTFFDHIFGGGE